jgi:type VI secretion system protein ImpH
MEHGTPDSPVIRSLLARGRRFSFFQAVRLLERIRTGSVRIGRQGPAAQETIRLRPTKSLGFPRSDLESVEVLPENGRYRITSTFLGLYGSTSPLPMYFSQELLWQDDSENCTRDFLDLFHHRLLSLFFRCWTKYRYFVRFMAGGTDELSGNLLALVGLATDSLKSACPVQPVMLIRYAGLITQHPHGAEQLRAILTTWFGGLRIEVRQFMHRWVRLPLDRRNHLGQSSTTVGIDLVVGARVQDRAGKFRVVVGPVGWERFQRFLPDGDEFGVLVALTRLFVTDPLEFDVEVRLKGEEVPRLRLGTEKPYRLGWTTWVPADDMDDQAVVFRVPEAGSRERKAS